MRGGLDDEGGGGGLGGTVLYCVVWCGVGFSDDR